MRKASRVALLFAIFIVTFLVPTVAAKDSWFFPDAGSQVMRDWQMLFTQVFWVALAVFVLVEGLLLYALIRFRRRKDGPQEGPHIHGNTKMEIAWTIAPTLVMAWLLVVSLQQLDKVDNGPEPDFTIDVVAQQFTFQFFYPPDYGQSTTGKLYVEEDKVVGLSVTATDVIHAFNIIELGVMIDAVPGKTNHFWFKADEPGEYKFQCRELCGIGHGAMNGTLIVFASGSQNQSWGPPPEPEQPNGTASPGNGSAPPGAKQEDVVLDSFSIAPQDFTAEPGDTLALNVKNVAAAPHNLYIGRLNVDNPDASEVEWSTKDLSKDQSETLIVELPDQPGAWEWWCNIPGHAEAGMRGVLSTGGQLEGDAKEPPLLPGLEPLVVVFVLLGTAFAVRLRRR